MKQSKKTQLWTLTAKRKNDDFAASLADEGCTNADNPESWGTRLDEVGSR